jgi:hypothetical protein
MCLEPATASGLAKPKLHVLDRYSWLHTSSSQLDWDQHLLLGIKSQYAPTVKATDWLGLQDAATRL